MNLDFLYDLTRPYYGESGQKSIAPVVFFNLCLVGYLENIVSDGDLLRGCSMPMDILCFLGYAIDEDLPRHSTIGRTRDVYGESVFEQVFTRILQLCVEAAMVSGHTQVIDSAQCCAGADQEIARIKPRTYKEAKSESNSGDRLKVSNKTHYSPTEPDARISSKPGKATRLNYNGNIAVDTAHHIITDVQAYHADKPARIFGIVPVAPKIVSQT